MNRSALPGEIAVGIHVRAGKFLDAVGLICGPLPTKLGAPVTKVIPGTKAPLSPAATKANPLVKGPTDDMFTITRPAWNDRVQQGKLIVAAKPPKVGMTPVTELEFKWVDAPKTQPPYINTFAVDTPTLLNGYPVDQPVTRGHAGRLGSARTRQRQGGALWVEFPRAVQPIPDAADAIAEERLLQCNRLLRCPRPRSRNPRRFHRRPRCRCPPSPSAAEGGSSTSQMRRSSSMVMPRGVEDEEGTATGGQAPAEQKP